MKSAELTKSLARLQEKIGMQKVRNVPKKRLLSASLWSSRNFGTRIGTNRKNTMTQLPKQLLEKITVRRRESSMTLVSDSSLVCGSKFKTPFSRKITMTNISVKSRSGDMEIINDKYQMGMKLGHGRFGDVYLVTERQDKQEYTMKVIPKKMLPLDESSNSLIDVKGIRLLNELEILKDMHHPNIVQLKERLDDPRDRSVYLIMQYLPG